MTAPLNSPECQRTLFAVAAGGANTLVAVLAAIGITGEFRHKTATATLFATPRRGRVVAAKLVTYALVGIAYQVATVVGLLVYRFVVEPSLTGIPALGHVDDLPPGLRVGGTHTGLAHHPGVPARMGRRPSPGRVRPPPRGRRGTVLDATRRHLTELDAQTADMGQSPPRSRRTRLVEYVIALEDPRHQASRAVTG